MSRQKFIPSEVSISIARLVEVVKAIGGQTSSVSSRGALFALAKVAVRVELTVDGLLDSRHHSEISHLLQHVATRLQFLQVLLKKAAANLEQETVTASAVRQLTLGKFGSYHVSFG